MATNLNLNNDQNSAPVGRSNSQTTRTEETKVSPSTDYDPFSGITNNALFGQIVNASTGSEGFNAMVETMRKTLKATNADDRFDVIPFPKEIHTKLHFSVIMIVRNNKVELSPGLGKHSFVTAQALLIESTGESLRPYNFDESNRRSFTITPSSEDVYNRLLTTYLREQLAITYKDTNIYLIDPVIVRRTFDVTKEELVKAQLVESQVAVETRSHIRVPNFTDFNYVKKLGSKDLQLPVTVSINGGETRKDTQGLPIYTDAVVDVAVEAVGNRSNRSYVPNSPDESKRICSAGVMVDLVPVDPELLKENQSRSRSNRDFIPEFAWAPRAVVTAIEQYLTRTPSGIFFAIASVAELGQDRKYAQTFRPSKGNTGGFNPRDIGYLNIEANLDYQNNDNRYGEVIDTAPGKFDDRDMAMLLDNTVTRHPLIAVDCMTTGSQAYYTTSLYNLARGGKEASAAARVEIINSLRDATGGFIDDYIDLARVEILEDSGDLIHTGYWYDNNGQMRDIREVDNYLGIATCAGINNPAMIGDWVDTYLRNDVSEAQKMSDRLNILTSVTSNTLVVTGTALRVTLNAEVLTAFVKGLEAGKLPLISRDTGNGDQFQTQRHTRRIRNGSLYSGGGFGGRDTRGQGSRFRNDYAASRY